MHLYIAILCINIIGGVKMNIDRELLRGSTNLLVLSVLEKENLYGYQMIKKLKMKSENVFEFQEGTLYPILHKLEADGAISSYWDETGSKKRRSTDPELPGGGRSAAALYDRNQSPSPGSRQHQPRNRNPGNG